MTEIRIAAERQVAASADEVYAVLADYTKHHPHILPAAFSNFAVEQGGRGAGTVVQYRLRAGGRTKTYRAHIEEPAPGRVLEEHLDDGKTVTSFTVTPHGDESVVRIESCWPGMTGIAGRVERALALRVLMPLFEEELRLLDTYTQAGPVNWSPLVARAARIRRMARVGMDVDGLLDRSLIAIGLTVPLQPRSSR